MRKKSKGQIAIFIILGMVLIGAVIGVVYTIQTQTGRAIDTDQQIIEQTETREEQQQARTFVDSCLQRIVPEGLQIMRLQGGYINIPLDVKYLEVEHNYSIDLQANKHVKKEPGTIKVPYYLTKDGITGLPSIAFMEQELATYVSQTLPSCLVNLEDFAQDDIQTAINEITTKATLGTQVIVEVTSPILLERTNTVNVQEKFVYTAPINFQKLMFYAEQLVELEVINTYLEQHTLQLIDLYKYSGSQRQFDDLPPRVFTKADIDCSFETWQLQETQDVLKAILQQNIPHLKIGGTRYDPVQSDTQEGQATYDSFIRKYFHADPFTKIDLSYNASWPTNIDVKPRQNTTIKPDTTNQFGIPFLPVFCTSDYRFKYDIEFPVLFTINDSQSDYIEVPNIFNGQKGFVMHFAMEGYIDGNQPRITRANPRKEQTSSFLNSDLGYYLSDQACKEPEGSQLVVKAVNAFNGVSIPNASVSFFCGQPVQCLLGTTNELGIVETQAPQCVNGVVMTNANGYKIDRTSLTTVQTSTPPLVIDLYPLSHPKAKARIIHLPTFMKHYYVTDGFTKQTCQNVTAQEMFNLTHYPITSETQHEELVVAQIQPTLPTIIPLSILMPSDQPWSLHGETFDVFLTYKAQVNIRPSQIDDQIVDFGAASLPGTYNKYRDDYILGTNEFVWKVTDQELYNTRQITFTVFAEHKPWDDLEVKDVLDRVMKTDGTMQMKLSDDIDCDGLPDHSTLALTPQEYNKYLQPILE